MQVLVSLGLFSVLLLGVGLIFPNAIDVFFQNLATLNRFQVSYFCDDINDCTCVRFMNFVNNIIYINDIT